jgi:hypothetical protein
MRQLGKALTVSFGYELLRDFLWRGETPVFTGGLCVFLRFLDGFLW